MSSLRASIFPIGSSVSAYEKTLSNVKSDHDLVRKDSHAGLKNSHAGLIDTYAGIKDTWRTKQLTYRFDREIFWLPCLIGLSVFCLKNENREEERWKARIYIVSRDYSLKAIYGCVTMTTKQEQNRRELAAEGFQWELHTEVIRGSANFLSARK